ncbi:ATP-binding protein [Candidatus Woesebacteria bacterium]|nr:MAG: ATP-binding protein [Candidatus Woesebacteria bacterium]
MLYILIGLPYSGKTTLTKELTKRFGFSGVSMDDIMDEKGYEVEEMTQDDWNIVYSEGYKELKKLLSEGKTVVLDLGNLKRSERETAKNIAKSLNVGSKLIYLNTPLNEIRARWERNEQTKERGQLEEVTLKRALGMFEAPSADENYITYNINMDLDEWVKENIEAN